MGDWTKEIRREERIYPPVHPIEMLRMKFLEPMSTAPDALAEGAGVPAQRSGGLLVRAEGTITLIFPIGVAASSVWTRSPGQESGPATT